MDTRRVSRIAKMLLLGAILCLSNVRPSLSQEEAENPTHNELRALRDKMVDAINSSDLDKLISCLHKEVIVTWLDGVQSRGHEQVRDYYKDKTEGENAIVQGFSVKPEVKELSTLYADDTAVAYGSALSMFKMRGGQELNVDGVWTATMEKQDGEWKIVAFHSSAGMFDNPLLKAVQRFALWGIAIAGVVGLFLGWAIPKVLARMRRRPDAAPT